MCDLLSKEDLSSAENILFIIGNGFDLSHDIESSYEDFLDYLVKKNKDLYISFDNLFNASGMLWSDLENTLGDYDEEDILNECRPDEPIDPDHPMRSAAAIEDSPAELYSLLDKFKQEFSNWVNSISLNNIDTKFRNLSPSSWYLSFNYLETLESLYHIPKDRVFHIHGSRLDHKEYVLGHNSFRKPNFSREDDIPYYEEEAIIDIINAMNGLVKDFRHNIDQCPLFYTTLRTIRKIVVVGHSLSKIDKPYFVRIRKIINPQTPWFISYHSDNDFLSIEQRCRDLQITNYERFKL